MVRAPTHDICPNQEPQVWRRVRKVTPVSQFVQLLWERGSRFETEVIENLAEEFVSVKGESGSERELLTYEAIN